MFYKKQTCSECKTKYSLFERKCPHCNKENTNEEYIKIKDKIIFLTVPRQIALFVIGFLFVTLIATIVLNLAKEKEYSIILANSISYVLSLSLLLIVLFPNLKDILRTFKNYKPYLVGLISFVVLYFTSILFSFIISSLHEINLSENETILRSLVKQYPFISIIVFSILGPIVEELTYRLGLFSLLRRFSKPLAYLTTIVIFTLIHFDFTSTDMVNELLNLPSYSLGAFILTFSYDLYGLPCSIVAHVCNNLLASILILTQSTSV